MRKGQNIGNRHAGKVDRFAVAVRMPNEMHERVAKLADENFRSVNSQILKYIAEGLERDGA